MVHFQIIKPTMHNCMCCKKTKTTKNPNTKKTKKGTEGKLLIFVSGGSEARGLPLLFLLLFFVFQVLYNEPKLLLRQFYYIFDARKYTSSL